MLPRLESVIKWLITEENVRDVYVGGYGGVDQIAATAGKRAKKKYPEKIQNTARKIYAILDVKNAPTSRL